MKLKLSQIFAAYIALSTIIGEKRPLPQKGKYRIGRQYDQLTSEFERINTRRNELVKEFGEEIKETPKTEGDPLGQGEPQPTGRWHVPENSAGFSKFVAAWDEFVSQEIEVELEPIPLDTLGDEGTIEAQEFVALGKLVKA